jgi:hypothetical protein
VRWAAERTVRVGDDHVLPDDEAAAACAAARRAHAHDRGAGGLDGVRDASACERLRSAPALLRCACAAPGEIPGEARGSRSGACCSQRRRSRARACTRGHSPRQWRSGEDGTRALVLASAQLAPPASFCTACKDCAPPVGALSALGALRRQSRRLHGLSSRAVVALQRSVDCKPVLQLLRQLLPQHARRISLQMPRQLGKTVCATAKHLSVDTTVSTACIRHLLRTPTTSSPTGFEELTFWLMLALFGPGMLPELLCSSLRMLSLLVSCSSLLNMLVLRHVCSGKPANVHSRRSSRWNELIRSS